MRAGASRGQIEYDLTDEGAAGLDHRLSRVRGDLVQQRRRLHSAGTQPRLRRPLCLVVQPGAAAQRRAARRRARAHRARVLHGPAHGLRDDAVPALGRPAGVPGQRPGRCRYRGGVRATRRTAPIDPPTLRPRALRYTHESKTYTYSRLEPRGEPQPRRDLDAADPQRARRRDGRVRRAGERPLRLPPQRAVRDHPRHLGLRAGGLTGFKGGGINPRPFNGAQQVQPFYPETLESCEVGTRATSSIVTRLNLGAFYRQVPWISRST